MIRWSSDQVVLMDFKNVGCELVRYLDIQVVSFIGCINEVDGARWSVGHDTTNRTARYPGGRVRCTWCIIWKI